MKRTFGLPILQFCHKIDALCIDRGEIRNVQWKAKKWIERKKRFEMTLCNKAIFKFDGV